VIKRAKNECVRIRFPVLNLSQLRIVAFADASFNNLPNGGSQGGNIIFLADDQSSSPLQWESCRIKRTVRSTLAAETLALSDVCDNSVYMAELMTEVLQSDAHKSRIQCVTDNQSIFDNVYSTKPVSDQELRLDVSAIREKKDKKHIQISWTPSKSNPANVFTKKGAPSNLLNTILSEGRLNNY